VVPISVLDLSPIVQGGDAATALRNTVDLARHAEQWGYRRYWLAEHHNMPGIASAATSIVIGQVAGATSTIRVGAGGIMLPNHSPLVIAEQFGTLATIYPGRIDLGIGRAPGTDQRTMYALRRNLAGDYDGFPNDVLELIAYLGPISPGQPVRAIPGAGTDLPVWILGSSLYGAQLAAALGLPYAFASHFAPAQLEPAIAVYRERFQPSRHLPAPYVMLGIGAFAAATDGEARRLFTSQQQFVIDLRSGRPGPLPPPIDDIETILDDRRRAILNSVLSCAFVGSPETLRHGLDRFVDRHRPDEVIVTAQIFDHAARLRSFQILSQIWRER
jgi:luciferase family oxidoreductase group 1